QGVNVVMDFGVWAKDERSALRCLAESVGASCELVYVDVEEAENVRRIANRPTGAEVSTFNISAEDLAKYRDFFQVPTFEELNLATLDDPPPGFESWESWAQDRWPSFTTDYG
ncbi:MAG: AAA family ATPase, partial [Minisyncoccia bacterium]